MVGASLKPRRNVLSPEPQVSADRNGRRPDPLVPPRVDGLRRDLQKVCELPNGQQTGKRGVGRIGRGGQRCSVVQERPRGDQSGGRSLPSRKASHSRTSPIDPSIPSRRLSSRSSRASRTRPSGSPLEVLTERRIERMPTVKVSTEPMTEEKAAITAAARTSLIRAPGFEDRRGGRADPRRAEARSNQVDQQGAGRTWLLPPASPFLRARGGRLLHELRSGSKRPTRSVNVSVRLVLGHLGLLCCG